MGTQTIYLDEIAVIIALNFEETAHKLNHFRCTSKGPERDLTERYN